MIASITPGTAAGAVVIPPSKSIGHRFLINAALAEGPTLLHRLPFNEDIAATIDCLRALGVEISLDEMGRCQGICPGICPGTCRVAGRPEPSAAPRRLNCRESGSTLRFLIPAALLDGVRTEFTGSPYLFTRPLSVYRDLCREQGFLWEQGPDGLTVEGQLRPGLYSFPGNISSQFITGLLLVLPSLPGDSTIRLTTELESSSYVDITLDTLSAFGVEIQRISDREFRIPGGQRRRARRPLTVEGDESGAAFFGALNLLGGRVVPEGLSPDTRQGDRVWQTLLPLLRSSTPVISVKDCPDLGPILMAMAAACHGAVLTDTARLRLKESDRGAAMVQELAKCGVQAEMEPNRITIPGGQLRPPTALLEGYNDHRIVMALAVLLTRTGGRITDAEAVRKSMPSFWELLQSLGISLTLQ